MLSSYARRVCGRGAGARADWRDEAWGRIPRPHLPPLTLPRPQPGSPCRPIPRPASNPPISQNDLLPSLLMAVPMTLKARATCGEGGLTLLSDGSVLVLGPGSSVGVGSSSGSVLSGSSLVVGGLLDGGGSGRGSGLGGGRGLGLGRGEDTRSLVIL